MNPHDYAEALLRELAPPRRNQFFYGKRMDVQHFRMEQDYGRLKQTLLNRLTLGKGVVCGLRVAMDGQRLTVDPGVAIDGLGREIVVPVPRSGGAGIRRGDLCGFEGFRAKRTLYAVGVLPGMQCRLPAGARVGLRYTRAVRCRDDGRKLLLQGNARTCAPAGRPALVRSTATRFERAAADTADRRRRGPSPRGSTRA